MVDTPPHPAQRTLDARKQEVQPHVRVKIEGAPDGQQHILRRDVVRKVGLTDCAHNRSTFCSPPSKS